MRHLLGLILAVILAAALFFAATWGFTQLTALHGAALTSQRGLEALGAMAGAGLLLGLLLAGPRVSPLATGLPGLVLLAWSGAAVVRSQLALRYIPLKGYSAGSAFQVFLVHGVLVLLGMAMIVPLFVPSRWRRRYGELAEEDVDDLPISDTTTSLLS